MNNSIQILGERELGQYPISIATSLAIEGAAGIYPEKEVKQPPILTGKYQLVMVNLLTLYRNLVESCDRESQLTLDTKAIVEAMIEEMIVIDNSIAHISAQGATFTPYFIDYAILDKEFPHALIKKPSTPRQLKVFELQSQFIKLHKKKEIKWPVPVNDFPKLELKGKYPASLILTHCATDLFSRYNFSKLDLLESHTGEIKPHTQWNSKLTNGKELENIPFNRFTLQVFGDKSHHFLSHPIKLKKAILEIAQQDKWTVLTTMDKIKVGLKKIEDRELRDTALLLCKM